MSISTEFLFRVWVHPVDGDPPEIEVWYQGLELTVPFRRFITEWVAESMCNEDFHDVFQLPPDGDFQVVGKGKIRGWYCGDGEYDEEIDFMEFEVAPVPPEFFDGDDEILLD